MAKYCCYGIGPSQPFDTEWYQVYFPFFRLETFNLRLSPLRERGDDLELLARGLLDQYSALMGKAIHDFAPRAMEIFKQYPFPGNVRELKNAVERVYSTAVRGNNQAEYVSRNFS
ncbi:hypothetical protein [Desulfonatronum thioautotrophicum]|uniref:hypothetical protein n=1 Tax=Desulfonatronum thioautotrophicum TaxID=617001 RepID=UPI0005EACFA1|nr:hypothetical protein [Desulfonatronum thioautotrophicum]